MHKMGCFSPIERTTSLHAPSRILNTEDEHEAWALFRGMRGLRAGKTVIKAGRCGVIVRDIIPISIQEWNKPKVVDPEVSYVEDRANFSLSPELHPNSNVVEQKVKAFALKKMAQQFYNWKKTLNKKFVDKEKTPTFDGQYAKLRDHWPAFVAYKTSEKGKKR